jgi:voltage-gated potassium channel
VVVAMILAVWRLVRGTVAALRDPLTRGVVVLVLILLAVGTMFYIQAESWSAVDSIYFATITLTTIGYGDLTPTSDAAKLFTAVYSLVGIGVMGTFIGVVAMQVRDARTARRGP